MEEQHIDWEGKSEPIDKDLQDLELAEQIAVVLMWGDERSIALDKLEAVLSRNRYPLFPSAGAGLRFLTKSDPTVAFSLKRIRDNSLRQLRHRMLRPAS